jgi:hypothetical protein
MLESRPSCCCVDVLGAKVLLTFSAMRDDATRCGVVWEEGVDENEPKQAVAMRRDRQIVLNQAVNAQLPLIVRATRPSVVLC